MRKETSRRLRLQREADAKAARSPAYLRAPISCIMGHVDTGEYYYCLLYLRLADIIIFLLVVAHLFVFVIFL